MKSPTYFSRWRAYPRSCAGHTAQGWGIGVMALSPLIMGALWPLAPVAAILALGYFCYQFGSGARKAINRHETDSIGWDCADLSVGIWLAVLTYAIAIIVGVLV